MLNPNTLASQLDAYLTGITPFGFAGAALVAGPEGVLLRKGYGLADRAAERLNTPDTVFSLGSITKPFTAAAVIKLQSQGLLDVQDPLSKFIPDLAADKAPIRLHHLLTHTAGLINYTGMDYDPADQEQILAKIMAAKLHFEPGSEYEYSNAGYSLLAHIIEIASGQPYETYLAEQLLEPAGLQATGYTRPDWTEHSLARWYVGATDNGTPFEKHYPSWNLLGNGDMLSTLDDLYRWHQALMEGEVLSAEAQAQMYTPFLREYGYGWRIENSDIGLLVDHNGASDLGTSALFRRYLDAGLTVVLFCNQSYGDLPMVLPLQDKIDQLVAGASLMLPPSVEPATELPEIFTGTYQLSEAGTLQIAAQGPMLELRAEGQAVTNLLAFPAEPLDAHADLNQATLAAFQAALDGDDETFSAFLLRAGERLANVKRMLENSLAAAQEEMGEFEGLSVVATLPSSFFPGALDTTLEARFAEGRGAIISISQEGKNAGAAVLEMVQGWVMPAVPEGDRLVGFHIPLERPVELQVLRADGQVVGLRAGSHDLSKIA
jgi:CubicO group peptidase (beta-lactamase class C family)